MQRAFKSISFGALFSTKKISNELTLENEQGDHDDKDYA